mgnify:CR=1 FL=1
MQINVYPPISPINDYIIIQSRDFSEFYDNCITLSNPLSRNFIGPAGKFMAAREPDGPKVSAGKSRKGTGEFRKRGRA